MKKGVKMEETSEARSYTCNHLERLITLIDGQTKDEMPGSITLLHSQSTQFMEASYLRRMTVHYLFDRRHGPQHR
jgi:hypothetical protein